MGPNFVLDKGFEATTAVGKFRGVALTANDKVKQIDTAGAFGIGVSQEEITLADATSGRIVDTRLLGISRCINGTAGALAFGTRVAFDNVGRVVAATAGQAVVGIAMISVTAQGDHVDVLLTPGVVAA